MAHIDTQETLRVLKGFEEALKESENLDQMRQIVRDFEEVHVGYCRERITTCKDDCSGGQALCGCTLYSTLLKEGTYEGVERYAGFCNYTLNLIP